MEISFVRLHVIFGVVFGAFAAHTFGWPWWGYVLAMPAMAALAYVTSPWALRARGLKPDISYVDFILETKRRGRM